VWAYDRYQRASIRAGSLVTQLDQEPWLKTLLRHGYVVGVVDVRGAGASFGVSRGPLSREEAWDLYDITEWFAAQPWCDGNIGMFGRSYLGASQYMAASERPPHLKAIFPEMALFDLYTFTHPGGIFRDDYASNWSRLVKGLDSSAGCAPIDLDRDGKMLSDAIKQHEANRDPFEIFSSLSYRNSKDAATGAAPHLLNSPSTYIEDIRKSGVAIYHMTGWYDVFSRDALLWFNNLNNPQKLLIGPWYHSANFGFNHAAEHLRWYDYWLKGIDNKVMSEEPIRYFTMNAPEDKQWRSAKQWPLPEEEPTKLYFREGASGSVASVNDGLLSEAPPSSEAGQDEYRVNYNATSGKPSRWSNAYSPSLSELKHADMTVNDRNGLTFTTPPLASDMELTGHPVVYLWVSSTAKVADFFVYLQDVAGDGFSRNISEGALRASHRRVSNPPFNNLGLPFHRGFAEDAAELEGGPVELAFDLLPVSNIFVKGHRIRLTITCADRDNARTPEISPPPLIRLYRNARHASHIVLPVIPQAGRQDAAAQTERGGEYKIGVLATLSAFAASLAALVCIALYIKRLKRASCPN
jgi:putative CocE/NonD family hydrolase